MEPYYLLVFYPLISYYTTPRLSIVMESIYSLDNSFHKLRAAGAVFHPVPLPPPEDWLAGPQLFPRQVISGYHADYKDYNADTWAAYILEKAKGFAAATSCSSFSGERFFLFRLTRFEVQD